MRRSSALFVSFHLKCQGFRAWKSFVARWIRLCIVEVYKALEILVPKGHTPWSLATSWAERANSSTAEICKATTWSNATIFINNYKVDFLWQEGAAGLPRNDFAVWENMDGEGYCFPFSDHFYNPPYICSLLTTSQMSRTMGDTELLKGKFHTDNFLSGSSISHNSTRPGWLMS